MKIEAGKYYKTRDGRKVGPMKPHDHPNPPFDWTTDEAGLWSHNGEDGLATGPMGSPTKGDLIAEWTEQIGTLAELEVKPGDVVESFDAPEYKQMTVKSAKTLLTGNYKGEVRAELTGYGEGIFGKEKFRLISRATPTPSIDLTAITTPFGLLDKATQDALIAHGGPYEYYDGGDGWLPTRHCSDVPRYAHRVKPAPKRETVTKDMCLTNDGHICSTMMHPNCTITYDTIDGVIDMATYRVVAK